MKIAFTDPRAAAAAELLSRQSGAIPSGLERSFESFMSVSEPPVTPVRSESSGDSNRNASRDGDEASVRADRTRENEQKARREQEIRECDRPDRSLQEGSDTGEAEEEGEASTPLNASEEESRDEQTGESRSDEGSSTNVMVAAPVTRSQPQGEPVGDELEEPPPHAGTRVAMAYGQLRGALRQGLAQVDGEEGREIQGAGVMTSRPNLIGGLADGKAIAGVEMMEALGGSAPSATGSEEGLNRGLQLTSGAGPQPWKEAGISRDISRLLAGLGTAVSDMTPVKSNGGEMTIGSGDAPHIPVAHADRGSRSGKSSLEEGPLTGPSLAGMAKQFETARAVSGASGDTADPQQTFQNGQGRPEGASTPFERPAISTQALSGLGSGVPVGLSAASEGLEPEVGLGGSSTLGEGSGNSRVLLETAAPTLFGATTAAPTGLKARETALVSSVVTALEPVLAELDTERGTASLELDDPTMGRIRIDMTVDSGRIKLEFWSDNDAVRRQLQEARDRLHEELLRKNLSLDQLHVGQHGEREAWGQRERQGGRDNTASGRVRNGFQGNSPAAARISHHDGELNLIA